MDIRNLAATMNEQHCKQLVILESVHLENDSPVEYSSWLSSLTSGDKHLDNESPI